jgi:hypothetical protein
MASALCRAQTSGPIERIFSILHDELAILGTLFFSLDFLWAVTGNQRLKKLVDLFSVKLA